MEQTTVAAATNGGIRGVTRNGGAVSFTEGDAFMLIIQNMLEGMGDNPQDSLVNAAVLGQDPEVSIEEDSEGASDFLALLNSLFGSNAQQEDAGSLLGLLDQLGNTSLSQALLSNKKKDEDVDIHALAEVIAALLSQTAGQDITEVQQVQQIAQQMTGITITPETAQTIIQAAQVQLQGAGEANPLAEQTQDAENGIAPPLQEKAEHTTNTVHTSEKTASQGQRSQQRQEHQPLMTGEEVVESKLTQQQSSPKQVYDMQSQYHTVVEQVKLQLRSTKGKDLELDVDALQEQVNAMKSTPLAFRALQPVSTPVAAPEETPVLDQLTTGIQQNLDTGRTEFTMKLNPESLGEITVKLVETEGKVTLHLITASSETARMINSDLTALREAVRPMEVEVHEAVTQVQENASAEMQGFDMMNQQQAFEQQQQTWQHHPTHTSTSFMPLEDSEEDARIEQLDAALDTYV